MTSLLDLLVEREVIGAPECALLHRWTLLDTTRGRLWVHHFMPDTEDRDPHDHPRSFVTFVVAGGYTDISYLPTWSASGFVERISRCRRGSIHFRHAEHMHRTKTGPDGAWTIVLTGPDVREWGFLKHGIWWPMRRYIDSFGHNSIRC